MFSSLGGQGLDGQLILTIAIAIAAAAAVLTFTMPLLETDTLGKRMKSVAVERDKIRQREREKLSQKQTKTTLRSESKPFMRRLVEDFDLKKYLGTEEAKLRLAMAGYRGPKAETSFLFARAVAPVVLIILTAVYVFLVMPMNWPISAKIGICLFSSYLGIKGPELFLSNTISKRQTSMKRAFPDSLDLLLICVESGMSIEHALRKVAYEIASHQWRWRKNFI